jgi:hypothetical protein
MGLVFFNRRHIEPEILYTSSVDILGIMEIFNTRNTLFPIYRHSLKTS